MSKKEEASNGLTEEQTKKAEELSKKINDLLDESEFALSVEFIYTAGGITAKPILVLKKPNND